MKLEQDAIASPTAETLPPETTNNPLKCATDNKRKTVVASPTATKKKKPTKISIDVDSLNFVDLDGNNSDHVEKDMLISKRRREPAHYMLKIESFSFLSKDPEMTVESDVFKASGHKWRLDLYPNGKKMDEKNKYISLYVVLCDTKSLPKGWEVSVDVAFFVYDHTRHTYTKFQGADENTTKLHTKKTEWGFEKLISLESFKDTKNGYLLNDTCVFGVEVYVVPEYAAKDRCLTMIKPPVTSNRHTWKIYNFSAVTKDKLQSEIFKIGKIKWELSLHPKGYDDGLGTHISVYLGVHDAASLSYDWRVHSDFTLRIKCQNANVDKVRATFHWFCRSADDWGFPRFIKLSKLTDAANGFLLNDTLIVEVEISSVGVFRNFI